VSRLRARHCRQEQTEGTLSPIHRLDGTTGPGVLRNSDHDFPHLRIRLEISVVLHQSAGGKADEPTTATASGARGLRTSRTRQSRMYGLEDRHSTGDWTFMALVTKEVDRRAGKPSEACPTLCQDQTRPLDEHRGDDGRGDDDRASDGPGRVAALPGPASCGPRQTAGYYIHSDH
jgi:hypothetical protein